MNDPFESLRIRRGEAGDLARVRKDWTLSYAKSAFARFLTPRPDWGIKASQTYWSWQKDVIEKLLARSDLWIAFWEEAPTSIVGWCVLECAKFSMHVHYVDVQPTYRQHGVAKRLLAPALEEPRVIYTHRTLICNHLPIPPNWTFDPRAALVPPQQEASL